MASVAYSSSSCSYAAMFCRPSSRHVVQGRAEADRVGDVARAGLEPAGWRLEQRPLEGDVGDHVAAALPGRHVLEHVPLAVERTDAGGPEDLVPGEDEEVDVEGLHVDGQVRDRLGAVDQHPGAVAVGDRRRSPGPG